MNQDHTPDRPDDASSAVASHEPPNPGSTVAFDAVVRADRLAAVLDAAAVLVDECIVRTSRDGVRIVATDPATVGLVSVRLASSAFESFETAGTRLGVDLERLRTVVGIADADDPVELSFDPASRQLAVRVGVLSYTLALIDPAAIRDAPDVVDLGDHHTATVALSGATFARGVDAAEMVSDHVAIGVETASAAGGVSDSQRDGVSDGQSDDRSGSVSDDQSDDEGGSANAAGYVFLRADGDTDRVDYEVSAEDCESFEEGDARSLFSVDYLRAMTRVVPADAVVRLGLGTDETPLELAFDVAGGDGRVTYVLAPRIQRH